MLNLISDRYKCFYSLSKHKDFEINIRFKNSIPEHYELFLEQVLKQSDTGFVLNYSIEYEKNSLTGVRVPGGAAILGCILVIEIKQECLRRGILIWCRKDYVYEKGSRM